MALSEAEKARRQQPHVKSQRLEWLRAYRQRPEVKERDRLRAQRRRDADGGAELNRARVKADRAKLGRNYVSELVAAQTGAACRAVPDDVVALKRESLVLKRMSVTLGDAAAMAKEKP